MHTVYEMAESVVVWLGPERRPVEDLDRVEKIAIELRRLEMENLKVQEDNGDTYRFDPFKDILAEKFGFDDWVSVHHFLCRAYFKRMWVFQEFVVADKLSIFCGDRKMLWEDIRNISQVFTAFGFALLSRHAVPGDFDAPHSIPHALEPYRELFKNNSRDCGLKSHFGGLIAGLSRGMYTCSVGHDMLYAHFGVCRYKRVEIDYGKTVEEVYAEFWGEVMGRVEDINFLCYVENNNGNPRRQWKWWPILTRQRIRILPQRPLPSWVPDFQKRQVQDSLTGHYSTLEPVDNFNASGLSDLKLEPAAFQVCQKNRYITVRGDRVATIAESGETLDEISAENGWCITRLLQIVRALADKTQPHTYTSLEERINAVMSTVITWSMHNAATKSESKTTLIGFEATSSCGCNTPCVSLQPTAIPPGILEARSDWSNVLSRTRGSAALFPPPKRCVERRRRTRPLLSSTWIVDVWRITLRCLRCSAFKLEKVIALALRRSR
jgi:hypothetical protein